ASLHLRRPTTGTRPSSGIPSTGGLLIPGRMLKSKRNNTRIKHPRVVSISRTHIHTDARGHWSSHPRCFFYCRAMANAHGVLWRDQMIQVLRGVDDGDLNAFHAT